MKAGFGSDGDDFNVVWVRDSHVYPFHQAEAYHQMHSNFFQSVVMQLRVFMDRVFTSL